VQAALAKARKRREAAMIQAEKVRRQAAAVAAEAAAAAAAAAPASAAPAMGEATDAKPTEAAEPGAAYSPVFGGCLLRPSGFWTYVWCLPGPAEASAEGGSAEGAARSLLFQIQTRSLATAHSHPEQLLQSDTAASTGLPVSIRLGHHDPATDELIPLQNGDWALRQHLVGGDGGRSGFVTVYCSNGASVPSASTDTLAASLEDHIGSVEERQPLVYHVAVSLNPRAPQSRYRAVCAALQSPVSAALKRVRGACARWVDGWWKYQLCLGNWIYQYHEVSPLEVQQVTKIGEFDPTFRTSAGEGVMFQTLAEVGLADPLLAEADIHPSATAEAARLAAAAAASRRGRELVLLEQYVDGGPCEALESKPPRSATVVYTCLPRGPAAGPSRRVRRRPHPDAGDADSVDFDPLAFAEEDRAALDIDELLGAEASAGAHQRVQAHAFGTAAAGSGSRQGAAQPRGEGAAEDADETLLVSMKEVSTCVYRFVVASTAFCDIPNIHRSVPKTAVSPTTTDTIDCFAQTPRLGDDELEAFGAHLEAAAPLQSDDDTTSASATYSWTLGPDAVAAVALALEEDEDPDIGAVPSLDFGFLNDLLQE
jgi:hypothetical protein